MAASSFVQPDNKSDTVIDRKPAITAKTATLQSSHPDSNLDPVIKKAKATIAAKMENPASVEFVEMKRADRKNALSATLSTPFAATSGGKTRQAEILEIGHFYISSRMTRHTSSVAAMTLSPRLRTGISAIEKRVMDNFTDFRASDQDQTNPFHVLK